MEKKLLKYHFVTKLSHLASIPDYFVSTSLHFTSMLACFKTNKMYFKTVSERLFKFYSTTPKSPEGDL